MYSLCLKFIVSEFISESSSEKSSHSHKQKRRWSTESADSQKHTTHTTSKSNKVRRSYSTYEAEASSTTVETRPHRSNDPCEWSIEEVVQHICEMDPALAPHTELFRKQVHIPYIFTWL